MSDGVTRAKLKAHTEGVCIQRGLLFEGCFSIAASTKNARVGEDIGRMVSSELVLARLMRGEDGVIGSTASTCEL